MSAYGPSAPLRSGPQQPATAWRLTKGDNIDSSYLSLHHLTKDTAAQHDGLIAYTHYVFAAEVEAGLTYPQEVVCGEMYTREAFENYMWSGDVIVAVTVDGDASRIQNGNPVEDGLDKARNSRRWDECLVGWYYVKPNYPGRSSHICNAGFVIPPLHRRFGYGKVLGASFLHYAPALGYKASVFNLVYTSNVGSMRIWDSLGFQRAGLIPRAGRLKKPDGSGEEWTDAIVFYKSFLSNDDWEGAL
ncbi:hypothetical protein K488DRAFT_76188 [Vararia minispora EC-137]|uniref:Uncharacterized protein n=1 Tax=Vararia minispora EC-137 TaxID=1314806 RepID=A0ACB8QXA6_9AGAM|nr:hypothetical protein K488DRAFT_76188 [Vararia minispora EC-137]